MAIPRLDVESEARSVTAALLSAMMSSSIVGDQNGQYANIPSVRNLCRLIAGCVYALCSKNFSRFPVTSNFWTHTWSIKCSLKNNQLHSLAVNDEMNFFSLISPQLHINYQIKTKVLQQQNLKNFAN